jgi:hypothetical protein
MVEGEDAAEVLDAAEELARVVGEAVRRVRQDPAILDR